MTPAQHQYLHAAIVGLISGGLTATLTLLGGGHFPEVRVITQTLVVGSASGLVGALLRRVQAEG